LPVSAKGGRRAAGIKGKATRCSFCGKERKVDKRIGTGYVKAAHLRA